MERNYVFFGLAANGKYERIAKSLSFPFLEPRDFDRFIKLRGTLEENELVGAFLDLAREVRQNVSLTGD